MLMAGCPKLSCPKLQFEMQSTIKTWQPLYLHTPLPPFNRALFLYPVTNNHLLLQRRLALILICVPLLPSSTKCYSAASSPIANSNRQNVAVQIKEGVQNTREQSISDLNNTKPQPPDVQINTSSSNVNEMELQKGTDLGKLQAISTSIETREKEICSISLVTSSSLMGRPMSEAILPIPFSFQKLRSKFGNLTCSSIILRKSLVNFIP